MILNIGSFTIGAGRSFVIAEIGNNHNGSFELAKEMIDKAQLAGADCVKFQMRHLDQVYLERSLRKEGVDLGTEYVIDLLDRFELSNQQHREISEYCRQSGILYMCTPWDARSVEILEDFGVPAYKVASADLTNLPLLDVLSRTKKPLILSTGMSVQEEVEASVDFLSERNVQFALLHCNSTYPAPFHDINLRWMETLKKLHPHIGYSGHERGTAISIAAVSLGACIIERHYTKDRTMEGPDHAASLEFDEFKQMVSGIREVEQALGQGEYRALSQGEMINRENLGKSLVAAKPLESGDIITADCVKVRSPGQGLSPQHYEALLGRTVSREIKEEDFYFESDLTNQRVQSRAYSYCRPWGVPVRYHDFDVYSNLIEPDFFEFHFSYSDMELNPDDFLTGIYDFDFVVHAPELFSGSRLMDLATPDEAERLKSLSETQRIIDITRGLKRFFPKTERPMIVANVGGFTMDEPLPSDEIEGYYERFALSLSELDREGVELIPQTMAPFPWHFGGQRYQNIFVKPDEIVRWCTKLNLRMCFDISHSRLTCNHLGLDFYDFAERVAPISGHIHMGDAKGLNGEGLQIGQGDIDFKKLGDILKDKCPHSHFIPEIWQGHKNQGEGFWIALEKLEGLI